MVDLAPIATVLAVLLAANGMPVLLKRALDGRFAAPIDGGRRFVDGRPWLGPSKTWRGLAGGTAAAAVVGAALGPGWLLGAAIGLLALAGDVLSSFTKRRLSLPSSDQALGLDQIPEALLPALLLRAPLGLAWLDVALVVALFLIGELALSRVLYRLGIRDRPH